MKFHLNLEKHNFFFKRENYFSKKVRDLSFNKEFLKITITKILNYSILYLKFKFMLDKNVIYLYFLNGFLYKRVFLTWIISQIIFQIEFGLICQHKIDQFINYNKVDQLVSRLTHKKSYLIHGSCQTLPPLMNIKFI